MKKLVIAAAAAAMVSGAFAIEAQVYDYTATVKTTGCKSAKVTAKLLKYFDHNSRLPTVDSIWNETWEKGDTIGLRKQVSVKIAGVIWGCDCPTIVGSAMWATPNGYRAGYMFWNQTSRTVYNPYFISLSPLQAYTTFRWAVFNRIDAMNKVEGTYRLSCTQAGQELYIIGAGFGTADKNGCEAYVKSMSGNVAGLRYVPPAEWGCVFCEGRGGCVTAPICDLCLIDWVWTGASSITAWQPWLGAVSGTWKIKYNSTVSKRLRSIPWISRVYTFKNGGTAALHAEFLDRLWSLATGKPYGADVDCPDYVDSDVCEALEEVADYYDFKDYLAAVEEALEDAEVVWPSKFDAVFEERANWAALQEAAEEDDDGFSSAVSALTDAS